MYVRERFRVYATWLAGFLILLAGSLIMILTIAKVVYLTSGIQWPLRLLSTIFSYSLMNRIWPWLPSEYLSVQLILGIVLIIISASFTLYAFYMNSIIGEAARNTRVTRLMGRQQNTKQSVAGVNAGRDVTITQIANADHQIAAWTHNFWKGPLGALVLAVVAIIIAAIITKFTGLTP